MLANESSPVPETPEMSAQATALPGDAASEKVFEACPSCGGSIDVSDVMPLTEVRCPGCGNNMLARKKFNNFDLLDVLGEGGMGMVFKVLDTTLNRQVALKVLKKECSANAEERAKLEVEARMTAGINHPHVVKVFGFGQDHGQFYLAMELVDKGSLDQLMSVQKRVAEAQILEVGIQIAQGLEAALNTGLIHRDIKPGNILFTDAHTAKLVDFGLAIVMDEEAQSRGEIWGTPYYIAPEKLDNQPEDFRSDMYSLGGTLFHAVAGRPPYEAESASMVALKQLKSQPVSLQSFAPDISDETAYVINRMMAKRPDDRYASYEELIGHLAYARKKLIERTQQPHQPKQRVVMESDQTRKATAYLSIGILAALLLTGLTIFLMRDRIFPKSTVVATSPLSPKDAGKAFLGGVTAFASGNIEGAKIEFSKMADDPRMPQPEKNWAVLNGALASMALGNTTDALASLLALKEAGLYSTKPDDRLLANFFVEVSRIVVLKKTIPGSARKQYSSPKEAFALLVFAVWDWEGKSDFSNAAELAAAFLAARPAQDWAKEYRPFAARYVSDWKLLEPLEAGLARANSPADANALLLQTAAARPQIQTGPKATARLDAMETQLKSLAKKS